MFTCISLEDNNYATFCFAKHRKTRQNIQQAYQKANCKFATKLNTTKNYAFFGPMEVRNISRNLPPQSGYSRAPQLSEHEFGLVSSLSVKILSRKSQKYAFLVFFFNCKQETLTLTPWKSISWGGGGGLNIEKINTYFFFQNRHVYDRSLTGYLFQS